MNWPSWHSTPDVGMRPRETLTSGYPEFERNILSEVGMSEVKWGEARWGELQRSDEWNLFIYAR